MATPNRKPQASPVKPIVPAATTYTAPAPTTAARPAAATRPAYKQPVQPAFLFDRSNYMWMLGGLALIVIGFFLLAGGKSPDPQKFNAAEIYSFRRITLSPLLMLIGFGIEVYAIMKRPRILTAHTEATEKMI